MKFSKIPGFCQKPGFLVFMGKYKENCENGRNRQKQAKTVKIVKIVKITKIVKNGQNGKQSPILTTLLL